ncbi:hypothetical protein WKI13_13230 [Teredinibacter turnerae]|uniref:hypothetical protein n=1 Tax=Teredinibacter turnerae TaxID=2426 RepID=UPI0003753057|nr:hypothetical protein [Teredinibacter turnerae]
MKTFSITTRKNVAAVFLGPLLLVPVMTLTYVFLALFNGSPTNLIDVVGVSLFFSLWGLIIAYPAALFLGVPSILLLKRYKKLNYFSVVLSGVAWSIPIALNFGIDTSSTIFVSYCAAIVATGCWLVYRYV